MSAIVAIGLEKTYGSWLGGTQRALRGVDLTIARGSAFGLIGLNGAGKTTLIKTLLGVVRPTAGTVQVLGGSPEDPAVRARIGYLPERLHLPHARKPMEFLASVSRLKGLAPTWTLLHEAIERVGLGAAKEQRIGSFSKGMRQRLGLAAALLGRPELLVLDEPTDGVDPSGRATIRTLLVEEQERGATLFLNSHLLSETERLCDRVGILSAGRLVCEGSLEELRRTGSSFRVRLVGGDAAAIAAAGFVPAGEPERWRCDAADPEELNRRLDAARAAGALLLELAPESRDLEAIFTDALGAAA